MGKVKNMAYCQNCGSPVSGDICQNCGSKVAITQPPPSKPPSKNVTKFLAVIAVVVVIILILSILLFGFSGSKESEKGKTKGVQVEMTDIDEMEFEAHGQVTGNDAEDMRETIDDWGDGDGQVDPNEVRQYENYIEDRSGDNAYEYTINFEEGEYSDLSISIRGAEGDINSDRLISVSMFYTVEWPYLDTNKDFYIIGIKASMMEEKQFSFTAPAGYEIYRVDGLVEDITSGGTSFTGNFNEDYDHVYVTVIETGSDPQTADDEPNNSNYTANSVSDGDEIFGTLDENIDEDDYYSIYMGSYDYIYINLYGPEGPDFDLRLYDSKGNQVSYSTSYDSNEYISYYTWYSSGTYYIRVQTNSGSGPYIMTVNT